MTSNTVQKATFQNPVEPAPQTDEKPVEKSEEKSAEKSVEKAD